MPNPQSIPKLSTLTNVGDTAVMSKIVTDTDVLFTFYGPTASGNVVVFEGVTDGANQVGVTNFSPLFAFRKDSFGSINGGSTLALTGALTVHVPGMQGFGLVRARLVTAGGGPVSVLAEAGSFPGQGSALMAALLAATNASVLWQVRETLLLAGEMEFDDSVLITSADVSALN